MAQEVAAGPSKQERQRRAQIMRAAIQCVSEGGIDGTTIRGVAQRAGVSTGMVSYYYRNKSELIDECIASATQALTDRIDRWAGTAPGFDRSQKAFEVILFNPGEEFPPVSFWMEFWAAATREPHLRNRFLMALERNLEAYRAMLEAEAEAGRLRDDVDVRMAANVLSALVRGLRIESSLGGEVVSVPQALKAYHFMLGLLLKNPSTLPEPDEELPAEASAPAPESGASETILARSSREAAPRRYKRSIALRRRRRHT